MAEKDGGSYSSSGGPGERTVKQKSAAFLWLILCILLLTVSAAGAEEGCVCLFRIRPQVLQADQEQKNGSFLIGTGSRRKQKTARLSIGVDGRSPEGETWNLPQLLRDGGGTLLSAWWRVEVSNPASVTARFLLTPDDGRLSARQIRTTEGWNQFDCTDWVASALQHEEPLSFTIQGAKASTTNAAELDLRQSWIYLSFRLDAPPPGVNPLQITDSILLDVALSALPEDHWALKQYQNISGSLTRALWPETGVPYYYGGHSEEKVLHRYFPQQESQFYMADRLYLCGFDCGSFLHWVEEKSECLPHDALSSILRHRSSLFPLAELPLSAWHQALLPGDILVFNHGTYHAGMILGTPRMYGLNAENAPELESWLDMPMMIHCGEDPFCYDRFKSYIDAQDFQMTTYPPDGGVTVSLLVPSRSSAPHQREAVWEESYGYFTVFGQPLTVFPLDDCTEIAWLHPVAE